MIDEEKKKIEEKKKKRRRRGRRRRGAGGGGFCIFVLQLYGLRLMANEGMPYAKIEECERC